MPHLICYDISNDSLRTQMGKKIIAIGMDRINKSVYLGRVKDIALQQLEKTLDEMMQKKGDQGDSLIVLSLQPFQVQSMRIYGENSLDREELSGDKSTHII